MNIPANLRYTRTHEWVRVEGDMAVIGITDHAQHELSDVVHVELPTVDAMVTAGQACAVVESVKAASDIYAPVTGEVTAVNDQVASAPELINRDPYGQGWLWQVRLADPSQTAELLAADDYTQHIGA